MQRQATVEERASALVGTWHNELGSELVLHRAAGGCLEGTYRSGVGATRAVHPVSGTAVGAPEWTLVGFAVGWPAAGSVCTWSGRYEPEGDRIVALWVLTSSGEVADTWRSTCVGTDEFRRAPAGGGR